MMKKVWPVLLAVVLVFGLVVSCGGGGGGGDFVPFEWDAAKKGPIPLVPWGSNAPEYDEDTGTLSITASSSTGFYFLFSDLGYTLNRSDTFIFTYEVDVKTPVAIVAVKSVKNGQFDGDSDYGIGNGREYPLGHDKYSVYDGPKVVGTWDAATKTGTFEVLMKFMKNGADAIGFQHNYWADFHDGDGLVAEDSEYTLKITKIQNKKGEDVVDPDVVIPDLPETNGTKLVVKVDGTNQDTTVNEVSGTVGYLDDNSGYVFIREASWQASYGYFALDLGDNVLSDFETLKFKYQGISGDIGYKNIFLVASRTEFSGGLGGGSDAGVAALTVTNSKQMNGTAETEVELDFIRTKASAYDDLTTVYFTIFFNAKTPGDDELPTTFSISDIEFVKAAEAFAPVQVSTEITGISAPAGGSTPASTITGTGFTGVVSWTGTLDADGKFVQGNDYTATIVLTKTAGYTFAGILANSFTIEDATSVTHIAGTDTATTLTITVAYPAATGPVVPVEVWKPTITASTTMDSGNEYIGSTGIKRDSVLAEISLAPIANGFTATVLDGQYKQFCIQVGPAAGGTDYYCNPDGFTADPNKDYTITFMASVATGTGQLRAGANNNAGNWPKSQDLTTTPAAFTYSWTQGGTTGGGNLKFDTGNSAVGTVITITDIVITTP